VKIEISDSIREKLLKKHGVTPEEVSQCFANREGGFLEDTREEHRTDPPTQWFVSETDRRRKLKVVFIARQTRDGPRIFIRTAYPANADEIRIYERFGK
jgi:uncharacterized DUF497 family protein